MKLRKYLYVLLICLVCTLVGFFLIYKGLALNFLSFVVYFSLFIFFPTHFFSKKIIPLRLSRLESFVFGYTITETLIFALQWFFNFIGYKYGIWFFLIFTILGAKSFIANVDSIELSKEHSTLEFKITWFYVAFVILLFASSFLLEVPAFEAGRVTGIYQDQLWNIGNTWSIVRGIFPTIDSRFAGQILGYHLIQSYLHATFTIISGIHPLLIQNYYFPLVDSFILLFTIGLSAKKFLNWSENTILRVLFILLFTKGIGWYYHSHLYANPLTFFHSLAAFSLFIIVLMAYLKSKNTKFFPLLACSFCVMVGAKATLAMLFLPALLILFCYKLLFNKDSLEVQKKELLFGLALLSICIALKFMIFLNSRPVLFNQGGDYSTFFRYLNFKFPKLSFPAKNTIFLIYLSLRGTFGYFANPQGLLFLFGAIVLISYKKIKKYFNEQILFLIISVALCIILENILRYDGSDAEIYFAWYGKLIIIFMFGHIYNYSEKLQLENGKRKFFYVFVMLIGFLLFSINITYIAPWRNWLRTDSSEDLGATITFNEFQAMKWLNTNAKDSEVAFSDRRSFPKDKDKPNGRIVDRFFAYSALSGKQFFVEGDSFNCCNDLARSKENWNKVNRFINSINVEERMTLLKSFNTNYFIQSLRFNKKDFSTFPAFKLVYSNPDINIYKIK